jgi:hypothetical protein
LSARLRAALSARPATTTRAASAANLTGRTQVRPPHANRTTGRRTRPGGYCLPDGQGTGGRACSRKS